MHVAHLSLHDFRSYPSLELALEPGVSSLLGRNGQGKTNVVEAIDYLSRLSSHRVSGDQPLVRQGAERAVVRASVVREERTATLEVEINPGRSNRARVNRAALPRARDLVGLVRTVVFAPDDLALVKGDPAERRRFADDLQVLATPRYAGTRADYDRVLKQRSSLLRTARMRGGPGSAAGESMLATLEVWDERLAALGAEVMLARHALVEELVPLLGKAYEAVARGAHRDDAHVAYRPSFELALTASTTHAEVEQALLEEVARRRRDEVERGVTLVGPHRDELVCTLGDLPVKGYASHGEGWSFALALRLASYDLLRQPAVDPGDHLDDPILVLDDVFAELDGTRRAQLAELVAGAEQVLVTAAVADDVPAALRGRRFDVADGEVRPHG